MAPATESSQPDHDVIVIGAGFSGLNAIYRFREHGLDVIALEMASGIGGTWFWNRYPGARVDIESLEYSYGFLDEIQQEWRWPMRWSEQPDVERYLNWVADKLDLRRHISFDAHVESIVFDEASELWTVTTEDGQARTAKFVVAAVGFLSAPYIPNIPGAKDFSGRLLHTAAWPREGADLSGLRVGVIGTGASAVQMIPKIADEAESLTVFQRTPNWCFPIRNEPISEEYWSYVSSNYDEIRRREYSEGIAGQILVNCEMRSPGTESALSVSPEERTRVYEWFWEHGAIHIAGAYSDILTDLEANATLQAFIEQKIRGIVTDQSVADLLVPDHPAWTKRPPGETDYYATFNRPDVRLVSVANNPIASVEDQTVKLADGEEHELDVLIFATGFDAGAGALLRMDIVGRSGQTLHDHWGEDGVRTHLGMMTIGFPNLFFINGPQAPSAFFSPPLGCEYYNRHICKIIDALAASGATTVEPTTAAQDAWVAHLEGVVSSTLIPHANSWWLGSNIPGKERRAVAYPGAFATYEERCTAALEGLQEYVVDARAQALELN